MSRWSDRALDFIKEKLGLLHELSPDERKFLEYYRDARYKQGGTGWVDVECAYEATGVNPQNNRLVTGLVGRGLLEGPERSMRQHYRITPEGAHTLPPWYWRTLVVPLVVPIIIVLAVRGFIAFITMVMNLLRS